jgi:hypothetical protein
VQEGARRHNTRKRERESDGRRGEDNWIRQVRGDEEKKIK